MKLTQGIPSFLSGRAASLEVQHHNVALPHLASTLVGDIGDCPKLHEDEAQQYPEHTMTLQGRSSRRCRPSQALKFQRAGLD